MTVYLVCHVSIPWPPLEFSPAQHRTWDNQRSRHLIFRSHALMTIAQYLKTYSYPLYSCPLKHTHVGLSFDLRLFQTPSSILLQEVAREIMAAMLGWPPRKQRIIWQKIMTVCGWRLEFDRPLLRTKSKMPFGSAKSYLSWQFICVTLAQGTLDYGWSERRDLELVLWFLRKNFRWKMNGLCDMFVLSANGFFLCKIFFFISIA